MRVMLLLPMARNVFMEVPNESTSFRVMVFAPGHPMMKGKPRAVYYTFRPSGQSTPHGIPIWTVNGESLP